MRTPFFQRLIKNAIPQLTGPWVWRALEQAAHHHPLSQLIELFAQQDRPLCQGWTQTYQGPMLDGIRVPKPLRLFPLLQPDHKVSQHDRSSIVLTHQSGVMLYATPCQHGTQHTQVHCVVLARDWPDHYRPAYLGRSPTDFESPYPNEPMGCYLLGIIHLQGRPFLECLPNLFDPRPNVASKDLMEAVFDQLGPAPFTHTPFSDWQALSLLPILSRYGFGPNGWIRKFDPDPRAPLLKLCWPEPLAPLSAHAVLALRQRLA